MRILDPRLDSEVAQGGWFIYTGTTRTLIQRTRLLPSQVHLSSLFFYFTWFISNWESHEQDKNKPLRHFTKIQLSVFFFRVGFCVLIHECNNIEDNKEALKNSDEIEFLRSRFYGPVLNTSR